ncbi:flagellar basal body protein FliL [Rhodobacterales bacterium HKCCE2091]|nr:flagellar basal body protein FliL [Rhodobacterales bacterium HKCCE2091]
MSVEADPEDAPAPKKKGMLIPLVAGLVLAIAGGGGGFWAVSSGPLSGMFGGGAEDSHAEDDGHGDSGDSHATDDGHGDDGHDTAGGFVPVAFIPLDTVTISLGPDSGNRHLIFSAQLEVAPEHAQDVEALAPRVLDVLNSYLRIVGIDELSRPESLARIRAQMLHRIQIVAGDGRVRDLLITEFVVN